VTSPLESSIFVNTAKSVTDIICTKFSKNVKIRVLTLMVKVLYSLL